MAAFLTVYSLTQLRHFCGVLRMDHDTMSKKWVTVLGSTGSIGQSTLDVVSRNSDRYGVFALVAGSNVTQMVADCQRVNPKFACLSDDVANQALTAELNRLKLPTKVIDYEQTSLWPAKTARSIW